MSDVMVIQTADLPSKPKLAQLQTPQTSTFPSELSPLPGFAEVVKSECLRTPITPPPAYTDFLKAMCSPAIVEKSGLSPGLPSAASSLAQSDCSCATASTCDHIKSSPASTPITPFIYPTSAPSRLSRIAIPPSPSLSSDFATPTSAMRSPFSARGTMSPSPYDWTFRNNKGRVFEGISKHGSISGAAGRSSVRHVREVVTRTVVYTPRMSPAPKGKVRKSASVSTSAPHEVEGQGASPPTHSRSASTSDGQQ